MTERDKEKLVTGEKETELQRQITQDKHGTEEKSSPYGSQEPPRYIFFNTQNILKDNLEQNTFQQVAESSNRFLAVEYIL